MVAIKKIKVNAEYRDGLSMDAIREVKYLQELSHPNIIALHDVFSSNPPRPTDGRMQQATVNLFADMHVQASTLQPDLIPAVASSDASVPLSTINSPSAGAGVANGTTVTISGTATDAGGGHVAGVEVSTNGALSRTLARARILSPVSIFRQATKCRAP